MFQFTVHNRVPKAFIALFLTGFLGFQPGCGSWTGNPPATNDPDAGTVTLDIIGTGEQTQLVAGVIPIIGRTGISVGSLELTEARLVFDRIKIKQDQDDVEERDDFEGVYVVDLLTDTINPELPTIQLSPGGYKNIEMKMHKLSAGEVADIPSDDPLLDNSIFIKGIFNPTTGGPIAITMKLDAEEEFSLMKPGTSLPGLQVQSAAQLKAIIAFRLDLWFNFSQQDYDLSDLTGTDVVLEKTGSEMGKKLLEIVKDNIKASADFGEDKDGDGELGKDEDENESNDEDDSES